jgi:hypothetical protein
VTQFQRLLGLLLLVFSLTAANALASASQEATFQDNRLLLQNPAQLDQTLGTLSSLGVQRLRISVVWDLVAPDPGSRRPPTGFDGGDPAAYATSAWAPYDAIAERAARYGLRLNFNVTGNAPLWAVRPIRAGNVAHVWYPSATKFGAFVRAVGERYSGGYTPPGATHTLPRIDYWSIWNEPNVGSSSLSPQTVRGVEVAPRLYRALLDQAWTSLQATGHGRDTILVGEMASTGHADPGATLGMQPLRFLRALFCVDSSYRPLAGQAAAARGCPIAAAASARFRTANPALFDASGWSHHPYYLVDAPNAPPPSLDPDWVTLADLGRLETALDRVERRYGVTRSLPIYLTEYGLETNPPRSEFPITLLLQAQYLNQAEFMAWRDPRVRAFNQYLLEDALPGGGSAVSSFASGLEFADGRPKPSLAAYQLPIWLPVARQSGSHAIEVWGCVRPAKRFRRPGRVSIQLDGQTVKRVHVTNHSGYFEVPVAFPHSGAVRLGWTDPNGRRMFSRAIAVTVAGGGGGGGSTVLAVVLAIVAVAALVGGFMLRRRARALMFGPRSGGEG